MTESKGLENFLYKYWSIDTFSLVRIDKKILEVRLTQKFISQIVFLVTQSKMVLYQLSRNWDFQYKLLQWTV